VWSFEILDQHFVTLNCLVEVLGVEEVMACSGPNLPARRLVILQLES
jgi:hypothetical protein